MRFLHCADIHLDSPLRGLERYEGAPVDEVRGATRRAFGNLVALARAERVDFVVIAGDLYDGDWQDFNTGLCFARGMAELGESGIAVYVVRGNHDAASRLTRSLRLPANVHLLSEQAPETRVDERLGLAVHGQSFATAAVIDDLAARYPQALPEHFNLGLLHTALSGREGHAPYAPTTEQVLRAKGYDYWALGHVHAREVVATDPWVVYPGNLQGRHVRERGAKGAELVTVEDAVISTVFHPCDVLRFDELVLDIAGLADLDALLERAQGEVKTHLAAAEGRILGLRVRLTGTGPLQRTLAARGDTVVQELRAMALEVGGGDAWLEKVLFEARPSVDLVGLADGDDPVALLAAELAALAGPEALLEFADASLKDLRLKLPSEVAVDEGLALDDPAVLRDLLREAEDEILARLGGAEPS
ncbi:MAG: DNA repair exonuclease [Gammaproteobacteria bacterium]|nr:DNA repair exonuclease [Gammaproteobacteria bacterium]